MTEKKSLTELENDILPWLKYKGATIHHIKSDTDYVIYSFHYDESDMSIRFTYYPKNHSMILFSRPVEELTDGRFKLPF